MSVKTRFAPSPTGHLHLGNMRTALFNYLLAKKLDGIFLLRIEDSDEERSESLYLDSLMQDLRWLGLEWDEGPHVGGDAGPYEQTQRLAIYEKYYQELLSANQAYPCFCTQAQLALSRKMQRVAGQAPRYAGTCAALTLAEVDEKKAQGLSYTLRFRLPKKEAVSFVDLVKGLQTFQTKDMGDFIIRRSSDAPSFMFCNAIDDALMHVTHAIRGEDHLTNTPRQLLILQALGLPAPQYGHITLIVGQDNSPLSKRHGSKSVRELRAIGYLPQALNNYLARLGHYYPENNLYTLADLAQNFSDKQLGKSAARFDEQQMQYWQKMSLNQLSDADIWTWLSSELETLVPADKRHGFAALIRGEVALPVDAKIWAERAFSQEMPYTDEAQAILAATDRQFFSTASEALAQGADCAALIEHLKTKLDLKGKALFQPLRAALMGTLQGPELAGWWELMPAELRALRLK